MQGEELRAGSARPGRPEGQGDAGAAGDGSDAALVVAITRGDRQALARL